MRVPRKWQPREKWFVQEFSAYCSRFGCELVDIPDAIVARGQKVVREKRRPADAVLITPSALFLIEFKVGSVSQSTHQLARDKVYNDINPNAYFVVRKWTSQRQGKKVDTFDVKQRNELVFRSNVITDVIRFFKQKGGRNETEEQL